jgi:hypothetical protein
MGTEGHSFCLSKAFRWAHWGWVRGGRTAANLQLNRIVKNCFSRVKYSRLYALPVRHRTVTPSQLVLWASKRALPGPHYFLENE